MNALKTTFLLGAMTGLLLAMGGLLGGRDGMALALLLAGVMNFGAWFWSDKIVLRMYNAQPVGPAEAPELYAIVQGLAQKAGVPMPKLYLIPDPALNAFATGRGPSHAAVAATVGIVNAMDREELEGVLAHELSHVINRDTLVSTVAATLGGAISFLAHSMMWRGRGRDEGGNPLAALVVMILAPIAATLIQLAVSRSREYGADASGARLVGYPDGLARALAKLKAASERIPMHNVEPATAHLFIVNPLSGQALGRLFSTHPPLEERIARLMAMKGQIG
ncbi:MAG TPA: zinc metalloprotease HtpX [Vicinamibacteria bacterium]|nr:zinc metalloprotease HtpX [Vicinamibacteria bacterium]